MLQDSFLIYPPSAYIHHIAGFNGMIVWFFAQDAFLPQCMRWMVLWGWIVAGHWRGMLSGWLLFQFAETEPCVVNDMWEVRRRQDGLRCKVVKHNLAELQSFFACTTELLTVLVTAGMHSIAWMSNLCCHSYSWDHQTSSANKESAKKC